MTNPLDHGLYRPFCLIVRSLLYHCLAYARARCEGQTRSALVSRLKWFNKLAPGIAWERLRPGPFIY